MRVGVLVEPASSGDDKECALVGGLGLVYIELMGVRSEYLPGRDSIPRADLFLLVVVVSSSRVECTCASIISHTSRYRS